jgi:hypothetical protein
MVELCEWSGADLPGHLKTRHGVKEFLMQRTGGVRGWNSKTWRHADWGLSIWNIEGEIIVNQSQSSGDLFYVYTFDLNTQRRRLQLKVSRHSQEVVFEVMSGSVRDRDTTLPFHMSVKEIEQHFAEVAEGLEEGYQRLSIAVALLDDAPSDDTHKA